MEILNTFTYNDSAWVLLTAFSGLAVLVFTIAIFVNLVCDNLNWKASLQCLLVIIVAIPLCYLGVHLTNTQDKVRHNAIINDMNKIDLQKYKIVQQEGKLFTIEEIK